MSETAGGPPVSDSPLDSASERMRREALGESEPSLELRPLPTSVLTLWRGIAGGAALAVVLVLGGLGLFVALSDRVTGGPQARWVFAAAAGVGIVILLSGFLVASVRYRRWGFALDETGVRAAWGVLIHRSAIVPRNRVQTVTTEDGPLDRMLGLTTLTVHTAGAHAPNLVIPHLDRETVAWLQAELSNR